MTNKIYRLADEQIDLNKIVIFSDRPHPDYQAENCQLIEFYLEGECKRYKSSSGAWYKYAFVEVTPADFSDDELEQELRQKEVYKCAYGQGRLDESKANSSFLATQSVCFIRNNIKYMQNIVDKVSSQIVIEPPKEKTLADFTNEQLAQELAVREGIETPVSIQEYKNYYYKQGYEAGKCDAIEAAKITFDSLDCNVAACLIRLNNYLHDIENKKTPKQEKPESKYACAQCGIQSNQISYMASQVDDGDKVFCGLKCAENYEWIPSEFPRDAGKPCRVKNDMDTYWRSNYIFVYTQELTTHPYRVSLYNGNVLNAFNQCQVRRDSVKEG